LIISRQQESRGDSRMPQDVSAGMSVLDFLCDSRVFNIAMRQKKINKGEVSIHLTLIWEEG
jgi:hypothetical protein